MSLGGGLHLAQQHAEQQLVAEADTPHAVLRSDSNVAAPAHTLLGSDVPAPAAAQLGSLVLAMDVEASVEATSPPVFQWGGQSLRPGFAPCMAP